MLLEYKYAKPIIEDVLSKPFDNPNSGPKTDMLNMLRHDQVVNPTIEENTYVVHEGVKVFTGAVWPFYDGELDLKDKKLLETLFNATNAVGFGALLFIYHKQHKLMDYIPAYLSNPSFMSAHGEEMKITLRGMVYKSKRDIYYRYLRLVQQHPIMFETIPWLSDKVVDSIGLQLFKYGYPNAIAYIDKELLTVDVIYESITTARTQSHKRIAPPSDAQYTMMYQMLLSAGGHDKVELAELVEIAIINWRLARQFIKAKELAFNDALSVAMTMFFRTADSTQPSENYLIVSSLYDEYDPKDQWPTLEHVIKMVSGRVPGRVSEMAPPSRGQIPSSLNNSVPNQPVHTVPSRGLNFE